METSVQTIRAHPTPSEETQTQNVLDASIDISTLCQDQKEDLVIGPVQLMVQQHKRPTVQELKQFSSKVKFLLREWSKLSIDDDGLLVREISLPREGKLKQLVLPKKYHRLNLRELNDEMGHLGHERVLTPA